MKFKMNNRTWEIIEKSQEEMKKYMNCTNEETFYFGLCIRDKQQIWLCKEVCEEQKKQSLIHELTHCYITCYICMQVDSLHEEYVCDICANSHDIIHEIIENYFKKPKEQD